MLNDMKEGATPGESLRALRGIFRGEVKLWENARFVLVDVPLDRREARKILPLGLRPTEPPVGTLFVVDYTKTAFTVPYHEAALLVRVRAPLGRGVHCCWMVVNDDTALIYGRELLGYPKKWADIEYEESGDRVKASVTRRGTEVLRIEASRGPAETNPAPVFNRKTYNVGGMGQFMAINPIWMFKPTEAIHESYTATASVTLRDSVYDPIARLVSGEPLAARMVVMDIPGASYMLPVGLAGIFWHANTFNMRYR